MQAIDNGDLTIENISNKIEMIKALIEKLEPFKIEVRKS